MGFTPYNTIMYTHIYYDQLRLFMYACKNVNIMFCDMTMYDTMYDTWYTMYDIIDVEYDF